MRTKIMQFSLLQKKFSEFCPSSLPSKILLSEQGLCATLRAHYWRNELQPSRGRDNKFKKSISKQDPLTIIICIVLLNNQTGCDHGTKRLSSRDTEDFSKADLIMAGITTYLSIILTVSGLNSLIKPAHPCLLRHYSQ
jgi:hypothetical protein